MLPQHARQRLEAFPEHLITGGDDDESVRVGLADDLAQLWHLAAIDGGEQDGALGAREPALAAEFGIGAKVRARGGSRSPQGGNE